MEQRDTDSHNGSDRDQLLAALNVAIGDADAWSMTPTDGAMHLIPTSLRHPDIRNHTYRLQDFSLVDKRLPSVITAIFNDIEASKAAGSQDNNLLFSYYLQRALQFWACHHLVLPGVAFTSTPRNDQHVSKLIDVVYKPAERLVEIEYCAYAVRTTGDGIEYAIDDTHEYRGMASVWLNNLHPDWSDLLIAAQALDMSMTDALHQILAGIAYTESLPPPAEMGLDQ